MAEAPRNGLDPSIPKGLLEELAALPSATIRPDQVARGRRHALDRRFDDGAVVEEIAEQLLHLSHPA